jgi:hypothetical protein
LLSAASDGATLGHVRILLGLALLLPSPALADVSVGGAVGAGAQGAATYGALDLRLDVAWTDGRLGLGARGVWDDAVFRTSDWSHVADLITLVRDFEVARTVRGARLALAAGVLAPARVGHVVDGYRATLDDRFRTGVRAGALHDHLELGLEIDDVLDPALVAAGARWALSPPWSMYLALAADPSAPSATGSQVATAIEAGVGRRLETDRARFDAGVSLIAERPFGASAVAFASAAAEGGGVRWMARADVRAGTGSAGALFGPLYRIERLAHRTRLALWDRAQMGDLEGVGAGLAVGGAIPVGWLELGARTRPGLGSLVTAAAGAPMGRLVQAGAWAAIGRDEAAGAAEVRVAWAKTLFSALQVARIYRLDAMEPFALWSITAWFGAASE